MKAANSWGLSSSRFLGFLLPRALPLSIFLSSCGILKKADKQETEVAQVPASAANPQSVSFPGPKLSTSPAFQPNESLEARTIPEGLCVVNMQGQCATAGVLDRKKPTVIYIHGWTQSGETEGFVAAAKWATKFNVMLFRWHRRSFDKNIVPIDAEVRIWAKSNRGEAAFVSAAMEYKRMAATLGAGYNQEVRLVGHSLGAQLAVALVNKLVEENVSLLPNRLELLDPAVIGAQAFEKKPIFPATTQISNQTITATEAFHTALSNINIYGALPKTGLAANKLQRTGIVAYISATGLFDFRFVPTTTSLSNIGSAEQNSNALNVCLTRDLFVNINTQKLLGGPLSGGNLWAGLDVAERHRRIREYYFESIAVPAPALEKAGTAAQQGAFSASYPTSELLAKRGVIHTEQVKGGDSIGISDDVYKLQRSSSSCISTIRVDPSNGELSVNIPVLKF